MQQPESLNRLSHPPHPSIEAQQAIKSCITTSGVSKEIELIIFRNERDFMLSKIPGKEQRQQAEERIQKTLKVLGAQMLSKESMAIIISDYI